MMTHDARLQRFWEKVEKGDGCWLWRGARNSKGYGSFRAASGPVGAHRFAYEATVGLIPPGMTIDHRCGNPSCVNPDHLRPLSMRDNNLASNGYGGRAAKSNCCIYGHALTPENVWVQAKTGHRYCRECLRRRARERSARQRAA